MLLKENGGGKDNNMGKWQNLQNAFFESVCKYDLPKINPVYELPDVNKFIEFDFCLRYRADRHDRSKVGVHFFEDDYKFERCWSCPDRYAELLKDFGYVLGPDFSVYADFPFPVRLYNYYRNAWLTKYWQENCGITVVPTVMWGEEDTWDWCFDNYPKNSIVAVSNVGTQLAKDEKEYFTNGYNEMLRRLNPSKILLFTRNFAKYDGNIQYIRWESRKGEQLNG